MRVSFFGVRGSVPAPGADTARYGGNTSCVEVRLSDGTVLALDAGTGLRTLGNALVKEGLTSRVHLLLSHTHWDHILGLPFFAPLWNKNNQIFVYPLPTDAQERFQRTIFDDIHFPVSANDIPAKVEFVKPAEEVWRIGPALIRRAALNHPGSAQGFLISDEDGTSLAYLTDNELGVAHGTSAEELARFADGVNLLIHDSQYVGSDMPQKRGWGHSVVDDVLRLGVLAEPQILALFHHDPDRTDQALDAIGQHARSWMHAHSESTQVVVACEGMSFDLGESEPIKGP
ncbi:MAG TPA: MBL fold metallo-hydrolase [Polyangiaceae bacterium]|jgi:phosphoribosyl 1,2-cyclic phosphodiesterase